MIYSETKKEYNLKRRYNITLNEWNSIKEKQNNKCAICKKEKRLVVEHSHRTGHVRGATCDRCNSLVAMFENDLHLFGAITTYLGEDFAACIALPIVPKKRN